MSVIKHIKYINYANLRIRAKLYAITEKLPKVNGIHYGGKIYE